MVEIKNLQFNYRKKKPLINGLNLSLEAGNVYGLLGKNGAGKSTLLKIMGGLIFPKNGDCTVFGLAPQNRNPDFLSEIYFIPEEFYLPPLAISKFVTVYGAFYPRFSETQFYGYLAEYGLTEKDRLNQLSYGQKKKVLIGFGLATNCKLLLMDEPTNGLDIPSKSQFRKTMASSVSPERTFIISTHQVRDLESLIDPIIIMDKGEIVFNESTMSISQKLKFELRKSSTMTNDDIFSQPVFGGSYVVSANKGGEETNVELEVLFNAINSNRDQVNQIFKS